MPSRKSQIRKQSPPPAGVIGLGLMGTSITTCLIAAGHRVVGIDIHDWPSRAYRGTIIDLNRGQLPTIDELDFLARWKTNQYYSYSEAAITLDISSFRFSS